MEQILVVAATVLVAVLVAVAVPALLQLRRTLRNAETFLETTVICSPLLGARSLSL